MRRGDGTEAAKLWRSHNFFAVARIVAAFEKARTELAKLHEVRTAEDRDDLA